MNSENMFLRTKKFKELRPDYYGGKDNPLEVFKIIRHYNLGFFIGNALKYIIRLGNKDSETKEYDLRKAITYLQNELDDIQK